MTVPLTGKLTEVFQFGSEKAGVLDISGKHWPAPGQYLACQNPADPSGALITPLFKVIGIHDRLCVSPLPARWQPGDVLVFQPPQGQGFTLPAHVRRMALFAFEVSPARLLTLIEIASTQNADIALFCEPAPSKDILLSIPSMIEIADSASLLGNLDWPEYLAIDLAWQDLDRLSALFGDQGSRLEGQVLLRTAMPCRGMGECGVCSVKTRRGWRFVCSHGPVFDLSEVLNVA